MATATATAPRPDAPSDPAAAPPPQVRTSLSGRLVAATARAPST